MNFAFLLVWGFNSFKILSIFSFCVPAYLAEYRPGAPFNASTHKPESSAREILPVVRFASFAFIYEFSSNVEPFSTGLKSEDGSINSILLSRVIFF